VKGKGHLADQFVYDDHMANCPDQVKGVIVERQTVSVIQSNDTKKIVGKRKGIEKDDRRLLGMIGSRPIWTLMRQSS